MQDNKMEVVILIALVGIFATLTTGCAGIRVGADISRIDEASEQHAMSTSKMPWKCLFVNCNMEGHAS